MSLELKNLPDLQLLAHCRNGSEAAFNILFRRYFDDLLQFAAKQVNSRELAEELVMDLMLKLWELDLSVVQQLDQYLFRTLKNAIIDHWRKKALAFVQLEDAHEPYHPLSRSADCDLLEKEVQRVYREKLDALSPQRRLVFTLSREQDLTHAEIAQQTNLSLNTVKNHLKAALNHFRENLKAYTEATLLVLISHIL